MLKHQVFFLCYRRSIYFYKAELCDFLKNVKLKKILLGIAYNILYNNLVMQFPYRRLFMKNGDPYEIRTRVAGVRGRSLRPLDQRAR